MSDEAPGAGAPQEVQASACPITDEFLPQNMRKHVDVKAPVPLRMMAAKALVPLAPSDMLGVLFMLMYDPEASVRDTAAKTAGSLPDRIVSAGFRDEGVKPPVLGWFLQIYASREQFAETLILNASTPDESVAAIASACSQHTAEIIGANQLRLLRYDDIIRELAKNPIAQGALIDGVCDFAVRNGLFLADVPQMGEARVRLFGPEVAQQPVETGPTAEEVLKEFQMEEEAAAAPMEERKKQTLNQKIMKMSIAEKIKLATKGNKEARGLLIRDSNKLVSVAVIRSPRITDGEVLSQAQNKIVSDDVLRVIYNQREWIRQYPIKLALVKNPKVPAQVTMKFLSQLHESDVKTLARDKNVPGTVQMLAKKMIEKKHEAKKEQD